MSLRPYCGEFLVSPVPLHLGLNQCSHGCWYCFANLNTPNKRVDYDSVLRRVQNIAMGKIPRADIASHLLARGFPILVSNDSDPFAKSNEKQFLAMAEAFGDLGISMTFQTRGGTNAAKFLGDYKPTMVYISVTSDDDGIIRQHEPNAPGFESRKELIQVCKEAGHFVVIGLNPFIPEWWQNFPGFVDWLKITGIDHAWCGHLHLSNRQIPQIPAGIRARNEDLIARARKRKHRVCDEAVAIAQLEDVGIKTFSTTSRRNGFWSPYFDLGYPYFPTLDGFLMILRLEGGGNPVAFSYDYFQGYANFAPDLVSSALHEYVVGFGMQLRAKGIKQDQKTVNDILELIWDQIEYPSQMRHPGITLIVDETDNKLLTDSRGRYIWAYTPDKRIDEDAIGKSTIGTWLI